MTTPSNSEVQNILPVQAYFNLDGSFNTFIGQGQPFVISATDSIGVIDTSVNGTFYPTFSPISSGQLTSIDVTSSTLTWNPGTGVFSAPVFSGYLNGDALHTSNITGGTASNLVYQITTGETGFIPNGTSGQYLRSNGTSVPTWQTVATSVTIVDDTTNPSTFYPLFYSATSGSTNTVETSSTKFQFVPSTGTLSATIFSGSGAGLTNIPNSALTNSSFTLGSTSIALGSTIPSIAGLTNVTATNFIGGLASATGLPLTTGVTGVLPIANGGTNSTATPTNGGIGYGNGTAYAFSSAGTNGQFLQSTGAGAPAWATISTTASTIGIASNSTNASYFPLFYTAATAASATTAYTASNYSFNPSTGTLSATAFTENTYAVVSQKDVGSAPNQVPLNQYLGKLAFMDIVDTISNNPYYDTAISDVQPTLNLDFVNAKTLDSRITFTRASTATYYDAKSSAVAEQNLFTYSQDFSNAAWTANSVTVATGITAPDGTTTANSVTSTSSGASCNTVRTTTLTASTQYTFSVYAKAGTSTFLVLTPYDGTNGNRQWFNLSTGALASTAVLGTTFNSVSSQITAAANGYYRCSITFTILAGTSIQTFISFTSADAILTEPSGNVGYQWGAQLEQRSSATAYNATTTTALTNYIPTLQTAPINTARLDYDPVTRVPNGLLIEEQRSNLLTYSDDFSNGYWTKIAATLTSNAGIAPDGTQTADVIVPDATNSASHGVYPPNTTVTTATPYTVSCYAKANGYNFLLLTLTDANGSAVFNLSTGALGSKGTSVTSSTITAVGNGWYRCTATVTSTSTSNLVRVYCGNADGGSGTVTSFTGNGYAGIYIWGAQLEAGAFPTSYIPTVASQVTRSADAASMTGTNFSSWYNTSQGSYFVQGVPKQFSNQPIFLADSTGLFSMYIGANAIPAAYQGGALSSGITVANFTPFKMSYSFNSTGNSLSANGASVASSTGNKVPSVTTIQLGQSSGSYFINGYIQKIQYYPLALSNAELQEMTL